LRISLNVGRTLALMVLGVLTIGGAIFLWSTDQPGPAAVVFALGEAIVVGGFGIAYGERSGAQAANAKLTEGDGEPPEE